MPLSFRPFRKSDSRYLADAFDRFQDEIVKMDPRHRLRRLPGFGVQYGKRLVRRTLSRNGVILLAVEKGKVVGFIAGAPDRLTRRNLLQVVPHRPVVVMELWVEPNARAHGVGRKLLAEFERMFRARGYDLLQLYVFAHNRVARRFYRSYGFEERNLHLIKPM